MTTEQVTDGGTKMNKPTTTAIVIVAMLASACVNRPLRSNYDRYTGKTNVEWLHSDATGMLGTDVISTSMTGRPSMRAGVVWRISRMENVSRGWSWLKCHRIDMLIDGRPAQLGEPQHTGDVSSAWIVEHVLVTVPAQTLRRMNTARTIEWRLCRDEFIWPRHEMEQFDLFVRQTVGVHDADEVSWYDESRD